ncbi:MAG: hypothetical protein U0269_11315 [Polyangiales bacterium]
MAYDRNEPKTTLITGLSVFVVVLVVLVRYAIMSYFNIMHDQEEQVKIATRGIWQLTEMRASAAQRLSGGAMPIDQAMAAVSQGQRPAAVSPRPSTDTAAMTGWMQMTRALPTEMPQNEPPPPPPVDLSVDGGAAGDAAAPAADGAAVVAPANPAAVVAPAAAQPAAPAAQPAAPAAQPAAHAAEAHPAAAH